MCDSLDDRQKRERVAVDRRERAVTASSALGLPRRFNDVAVGVAALDAHVIRVVHCSTNSTPSAARRSRSARTAPLSGKLIPKCIQEGRTIGSSVGPSASAKAAAF